MVVINMSTQPEITNPGPFAITGGSNVSPIDGKQESQIKPVEHSQRYKQLRKLMLSFLMDVTKKWNKIPIGQLRNKAQELQSEIESYKRQMKKNTETLERKFSEENPQRITNPAIAIPTSTTFEKQKLAKETELSALQSELKSTEKTIKKIKNNEKINIKKTLVEIYSSVISDLSKTPPERLGEDLSVVRNSMFFSDVSAAIRKKKLDYEKIRPYTTVLDRYLMDIKTVPDFLTLKDQNKWNWFMERPIADEVDMASTLDDLSIQSARLREKIDLAKTEIVALEEHRLREKYNKNMKLASVCDSTDQYVQLWESECKVLRVYDLISKGRLFKLLIGDRAEKSY